MGTTGEPEKDESDERRSFGSGLEADFKPLGKRIVVVKARDAKPLKIKRKPADTEGDH